MTPPGSMQYAIVPETQTRIQVFCPSIRSPVIPKSLPYIQPKCPM
jgi:hypothetical protein